MDWISIKDKLPNHKEVLISIGIYPVYRAFFNDKTEIFSVWAGGDWIKFTKDQVKYWHPCPEPPDE